VVGARFDIMIDSADDLGLDVELAEFGSELPKQFLRRGRLIAFC
jgi:hypothetical protein